MGVINVTPDSFSDGGRWLDPDTAIRHGHGLVRDGADLVDVGGESTRPGAIRIDADEELRRVIPVVRGLAADGIVVSVDTMRAEVAEQALGAGASLINDVSGGRADPRMIKVAVEAGSPLVLMHWRGHSDGMQTLTTYEDVLRDVVRELSVQIDAALAEGVPESRIVVDPGLGFSKTADQNWVILAHLDAFMSLGFPLLVAASRKRFLGELLAGTDGELRPTDEREAATVAISTLAAAAGAWAVRVHESRPSADAVRVVARLHQEGGWTHGLP
jgi:dihydropteroate synthase